MTKEFTIDEVFEMAKKIEKNGKEFYLNAADVAPLHKSFFLKLAEQEGEHEEVFNQIHNNAKRSGKANYEALKNITKDLIFNNSLSGNESAEEILKYAIAREGDSILFFLGLKEFISNLDDKKIVDQLILEERKHIIELKEVKASFF